MKKGSLLLMTLLAVVFFSCNSSSDKKKADTDSVTPATTKTPADSLMDDIMEGHNIAMAKMGKLDLMQSKVKLVLDSLAKLPGKAKTALVPYQAKMQALLKDLQSAKYAMDEWMDRFNMDSSLNNMEQRLKYLEDEKLKVSTVKKNILESLQKADSLVQSKF